MNSLHGQEPGTASTRSGETAPTPAGGRGALPDAVPSPVPPASPGRLRQEKGRLVYDHPAGESPRASAPTSDSPENRSDPEACNAPRPHGAREEREEKADAGDAPAVGVPVKVVWARPISGRGQEVCILNRKGEELIMLDSLAALDPASRALAEAALADRYRLPKIQEVIDASASFGTRTLHVRTDLGIMHFAFRRAVTNVNWVGADRVVIRDVLDNRYEIESFAALAPRSRALLQSLL